MAALVLVASCGDAVGPTSSSDILEKRVKGGTPAPGPAPAPTAGTLVGSKLFVSATGPARTQADAWRISRPADAAMMDRIGTQPIARWLGGWNTDVRRDAAAVAEQAALAGAMPVFVAYNIPNRDCGSYSTGGTAGADAYRRWISELADGIRGRRAVVVLEPDAVAGASCLTEALRTERFALLADAVAMLKAAGSLVYIDAGHPRWLSDAEAALRLQRAGIEQADGFSINVSNFIATSSNVAYGELISRRIGGKHFIIDTSRNGVGGTADGQWCNPAGQALGLNPSTQSGHPLVDALLWIKYPGESDGTCNGGLPAGQWWADYALGLAQRQASGFFASGG